MTLLIFHSLVPTSEICIKYFWEKMSKSSHSDISAAAHADRSGIVLQSWYESSKKSLLRYCSKRIVSKICQLPIIDNPAQILQTHWPEKNVTDKINECSVVVLLSWYGFTQWPRDFADKISTTCGEKLLLSRNVIIQPGELKMALFKKYN